MSGERDLSFRCALFQVVAVVAEGDGAQQHIDQLKRLKFGAVEKMDPTIRPVASVALVGPVAVEDQPQFFRRTLGRAVIQIDVKEPLAVEPAELAANIACTGYIMGVVDTASRNKAVCVPEGADIGQLRDIVLKMLRDEPERRQTTASTLIVAQMEKAFPCPRR